MQNELPKMFAPETDQLMAVIDIAKREERKGRALAVQSVLRRWQPISPTKG